MTEHPVKECPFVRYPDMWDDDDLRAIASLRKCTRDDPVERYSFIMLNQQIADFESIGPWRDDIAHVDTFHLSWIPHPGVTCSEPAMRGIVVSIGVCAMMYGGVPDTLIDLLYQVIAAPEHHLAVRGFTTEDNKFFTDGVLCIPHHRIYPSTLN